jgi:ABC-type multidrug transport system permease subunit
MVFVYTGQLLAVLVPDEAAATGLLHTILNLNSFFCIVLGGLNAGITSNFCGFMIKSQDFPAFWIFMYWLNPLHYGMAGVVVTQFHNDQTKLTMFDGTITTAEIFIGEYYSGWKYEHRGLYVMALLIFVAVIRYI